MAWHDILALGIGSIGAAIIIIGVVIVAVKFVVNEFALLRKKGGDMHFEGMRHELGMYLLLGLEFLIAADVVHTLVQPSLEQVTILAIIVAIRTVLSFFLTREMKRFSK